MISCKRAKRLLRLITRLYKSLRSEVAKRPPSNCTIGLKSGGNTGIISKTIHEGSEPEAINCPITRKRFISFSRSGSLAAGIRARNSRASVSKSMFKRSRLIASAPIPISMSLVSVCVASKTCQSVSTNSCLYERSPLLPGSSTTYELK